MLSWGQRRWLAFAGLLTLAVILLPLSLSEARTVFIAASIPCLHADEVPAGSSSGATQSPCDRYHCVHGTLCCMISCITSTAATSPVETVLKAPSVRPPTYLMPPPTSPNGFGIRPALPPPRAIV